MPPGSQAKSSGCQQLLIGRGRQIMLLPNSGVIKMPSTEAVFHKELLQRYREHLN
jgi:hypothetical protein